MQGLLQRQRMEYPIDMIQRARRGLVLDGCTEGLAANALAGRGRTSALDRAAGNVERLAHHLSPGLARAIDLEILAEHTLDLRLQFPVPLPPSRQLPRIGPPGDMLMVG